jgi:hypothetical protein
MSATVCSSKKIKRSSPSSSNRWKIATRRARLLARGQSDTARAHVAARDSRNGQRRSRCVAAPKPADRVRTLRPASTFPSRS